jgi:hypothetical protein
MIISMVGDANHPQQIGGWPMADRRKLEKRDFSEFFDFINKYEGMPPVAGADADIPRKYVMGWSFVHGNIIPGVIDRECRAAGDPDRPNLVWYSYRKLEAAANAEALKEAAKSAALLKRAEKAAAAKAAKDADKAKKAAERKAARLAKKAPGPDSPAESALLAEIVQETTV